MSHRLFTSTGILALVIAAASLPAVPTAGQSASPAASTTAGNWTVPRTADGQPDLQGIWDFRTITTLERPRALGNKAFFTDEEAAKFEQEENRRQNRDRLSLDVWQRFPDRFGRVQKERAQRRRRAEFHAADDV